MTPSLAFTFEAIVLVGEPIELGSTSEGPHRMIPITGGTVAGPRVNGVVLPGGADWSRIRPDGTIELEARYVIRTDDGFPISVTNKGIRHAAPEVMERLAAGEHVDPAEYYFRTTPQFWTAAYPYGWMTRSVFTASGERWPNHVMLRVWSLT